MKSLDASRRHFLRTASALSVVGPTALPFALNLATIGAAAAQVPDGYRALVCLNLNGGNDGNDTLVPTDAAYDDYQSVRSDLALPKSSLVALPGTSAGRRVCSCSITQTA